MQESRRIELQAQLDKAYASNDTAKVEAVKRTIQRETLECTAHTAERLKRVEENVSEMKDVLYEVRDHIEAKRNQIKGAKWLWDFLKIAAASGGGAMIFKALHYGGGVQ